MESGLKLMPPVVTLIPNYNGGAALLETLAAVLASDYPAQEVVVVDDGSTDGSSARARAAFPQVTILAQATNRGFAHAVNVGMAEAGRRGAAYVFLLNNDAVPAPDALGQLVAALAADAGLAAVMPTLYFYDRPDVIQSAGLHIRRNRGVPVQIGWQQPDQGQFARPADRAALHGAAMLIRRSAWEAVGPFWEPYFAYFEEVDWCVRARDRGYRLGFIPRARVWHHGGLSFDHASPRFFYLFFRNQLYFVRRNRYDWRPLADPAFLAVHYLRKLARALLGRRFAQAGALCRAVYDFGRGQAGADGRWPAPPGRAK